MAGEVVSQLPETWSLNAPSVHATEDKPAALIKPTEPVLQRDEKKATPAAKPPADNEPSNEQVHADAAVVPASEGSIRSTSDCSTTS